MADNKLDDVFGVKTEALVKALLQRLALLEHTLTVEADFAPLEVVFLVTLAVRIGWPRCLPIDLGSKQVHRAEALEGK